MVSNPGFSIRTQSKVETLEGIQAQLREIHSVGRKSLCQIPCSLSSGQPGLYQVFRLSEKNLRGLDVKEDIQLVYGKVYTLSSCKENWPGNKQKVKKAMGFQEQTWYDSAAL